MPGGASPRTFVLNCLTYRPRFCIRSPMSFAEHPDAHVDASIAAIRDQTLSPQRAADVIAEQCRQALAADPTNAQTSDEDDTPWLQTFLWSFWGAVVKLAQDDVSFHDRIAHVLAALKAKGSHGCEGWRVWGSEIGPGGSARRGSRVRSRAKEPRECQTASKSSAQPDRAPKQ